MDDMKKNFRQAKEVAGNECLKLDCLRVCLRTASRNNFTGSLTGSQ